MFVQRYEVRYEHDITQMAKGRFVTYEAFKQLQAENGWLTDTIRTQGEECEKRHNTICGMAEFIRAARKLLEGEIVCPRKYGLCRHDNKNCPIFNIDQALKESKQDD